MEIQSETCQVLKSVEKRLYGNSIGDMSGLEKRGKTFIKKLVLEDHGGGGAGGAILHVRLYLYSRSVARSNMKLIGAFLMKLWSVQPFFIIFSQNGR